MLAGELSSQRQSWVVRAGQHQELEPQLCPTPSALVPANKKKDPRYAGIYRDMPGYSGMGPRRLRPMIVGVPLEPGVGGMGGAYDIDAEGVDGGGPDPDRRRCRR